MRNHSDSANYGSYKREKAHWFRVISVLLALKGKLKNAGPATVTESSAVSELFVTATYAKPRRVDGMVTVKLLSRGRKVNGKPLRNAAKTPELFVGCPE